MQLADRLRLTITLGLAAFTLACDGTEPGDSSLTVFLTDAPGDVKAAVVTISEIYLQGGGDDDTDEGALDDEDDDRVVLASEAQTVDLLTLAASTMTLASGVDVPSRRYGQLRFVVTGGYLEVENEDGSTGIFASSADYEGLPAGAVVAGELRMPSFGQSGLKVNLPADALDLEDEEAFLLVDFDVAQSFGHETGSGTWVMHPVVTGTRVESAEAAAAAAAD
jgi:hypothetical protein